MTIENISEEPATQQNRRFSFSEKVPLVRSHRKYFDIFLCILIRCVFVAEILFILCYIVLLTSNLYFYALIVGIFCIVADGIYVIVYREGIEHLW